MADVPLQGSPNFDKLEVVKTGTASIPSGVISYNNNVVQEVDSTTIYHNLGFVPMVIAYYVTGGEMFSLPLSTMVNSPTDSQGNFFHIEVSYSTTDTYIYFQIRTTVSETSSGSAGTLPLDIVYYLLRSRAAV